MHSDKVMNGCDSRFDDFYSEPFKLDEGNPKKDANEKARPKKGQDHFFIFFSPLIQTESAVRH
jgi:hypothetical protein